MTQILFNQHNNWFPLDVYTTNNIHQILPPKKKLVYITNTDSKGKQKGTNFFLIGRNLEDSPSSFETIDRTNMPNPKNSQLKKLNQPRNPLHSQIH